MNLTLHHSVLRTRPSTTGLCRQPYRRDTCYYRSCRHWRRRGGTRECILGDTGGIWGRSALLREFQRKVLPRQRTPSGPYKQSCSGGTCCCKSYRRSHTQVGTLACILKDTGGEWVVGGLPGHTRHPSPSRRRGHGRSRTRGDSCWRKSGRHCHRQVRRFSCRTWDTAAECGGSHAPLCLIRMP